MSGPGAKGARAVEALPKLSVTPARKPMLLRKCACGGPGQTTCDRCADEEKPRGALQRKASGPAPAAVPASVRHALSSSGSPLDGGTRAFMESRFGRDFSGVRVHTGSDAAASARDVGAHAYTVGNDIVFASGRYDPSSSAGRHLLAHELVHTIQQQGIQKSAVDGLGTSTPGDRYEIEADAVAGAVMDGGAARVVQAGPPLVARQTSAAAAGNPPPGEPPQRAWTPLPDPFTVGDNQQATAMATLDTNTVAFRINKFLLPSGKGPVKRYYTEKAAAGALESTITIVGGRAAQAGLWQRREPSSGLRDNWLLKVGWTAAEASEKWFQAGGIRNRFPSVNPAVASSTCDMDHIVELQLGGTNVPSNIQALNSQPNQQSGVDIWNQVRSIAQTCYDKLPATGRPSEIMLHFDGVEGGVDTPASATCSPAGAATSCTDAELCAQSRAEAAEAATGREQVTLTAGGADAVAELHPRPRSTTLQGDTARNVAASELVPGAIIQNINRTDASETASGCVEGLGTSCFKRSHARATRVPVALVGTDAIAFNLVKGPGDKRRLRLHNPGQNVRFTYPYLSEGHLALHVDDANGLSGTGTLRPSLPLLNRLNVNVSFSQGALNANVAVPPDKIHLPFPGVRITRAELGLDLSPAFRPYGVVAFAIGPASRPVIDGSVTAEADSSGLVLRGDVFAHIPGVDNAQGHIEYRNRRWSGFIVVESTQIRLPYVRRGTLRADFNDTGYALSGGVTLGLPGGNEAELSVHRRSADSAWVYSGRGTVNVPGLHPVELDVSYDGTHLTASGHTGVTIGGLNGQVAVHYRDGRVTGDGTIAINRGRANGSLHVRLSESGRLSGTGTIRYQITPNLVATAGIEVREDRSVRLSGALEFPQPIPLFRGINNERELFNRSVDIPIAGVSLGPVSVGLIARITGAFGVSYGIGPGELRNARIQAAFNPLDENPDLDLQMGARLVIPAHAGLYVSVRGAVGLSAGIASVTGGVTARGDAMLRGGLEAAVDVRYQHNRFVVDAFAEISGAPALRLSLDADVTAEAGALGLSYRAQKVWHLAGFEYGSDLRFGLRAPLHYASDEAFRPPGLQDIQFTTPDINVRQLVGALIDRATV